MGITFSLPCNTANDVVKHCYKCSAEQSSYIYKLEDNLKNLTKALKDLTDKKNTILRRVTLAEEQQLTRLDEVQTWLTRVETIDTDVNEKLLQRRTEEINRLSLWGCCSTNYKASYMFGRKVSKKMEEITDLLKEGKGFEVVAEREPIAAVAEVPVEPTVGLESVFDHLWTEFNDDNVRIMGLYGMGGVGKTTLLKKINNNFLNAPSNYYVIWVVVSKDHTLEKIQNKIGEKLGYSGDTWKSKSSQQKAEDIFKVLNKKKFVMLLDDLWERVDLVIAGIPLPNNQNESKLVFTTRSMEVCSEMDADKKVEVKCLSPEDSWKLFKEKVGVKALNIHPDIPCLAEKVVEECDGLPIALITIGRAMAHKRTPSEWLYAAHVLRTSASKFSAMGDKVLPLLKFSYDNLSSEKLKSCFLYCALFPEEWNIDKDDLVNYWMCEGFLDEYDDEIYVKCQGYDLISLLLCSCLLEEVSESSNQVKMHDVIRDMALWIASDCGKAESKFLVKTNALLVDPPKIEKWNEFEMISLIGNKIKYLSLTTTCPNLSTLFLQSNDLRRTCDKFFNSMPKLTVLDLSINRKLSYLPVKISTLVSLQYLNLRGTEIKELPKELSSLAKLKYLNLEGLSSLDIIPKRLISSFSLLQVLNMFGCGVSKKIVMDHVQCGGNKLLVQELQRLKHVLTLGVTIKCVIAFERFLTSEVLRNSTQTLFLQHLSTLQFHNLSSMAILLRLSIRHCQSLEALQIDLNWERREHKALFGSLRDISIHYCPKLKDLSGIIFARELSHLLIYNCEALEEIISVDRVGDTIPETKEPFVKLEAITLSDLPKLKIIYPNPLPFHCLKLLDVLKCEKLKKLPISSNVTRASNLTIRGQNQWFFDMQWEDETTRDTFVHCFSGDYMDDMDYLDLDSWYD
ncbi:probable disease resistance protein At5g63020 [Humulus lupulus]|uniref:probable disease resistance protein At5g63020 n=1 Tax=Humulus lupulus TaxID=3486 RepID=UPI002B40BE7A|nr:probable disease resistance protein At5g63020 [Humulus lupulus]